MHESVIMKDEGVCDPKAKDFIRAELKNNVRRDYPIVEFIRRVWKFDPSAIPQTCPDGSSYVLPRDLCDKYLSSPDYMKQADRHPQTGKPVVSLQLRSETKACEYFEELFQKTTDTVKEAWKHHDPQRFEKIEARRYIGRFRFLNEAIIRGNYADYKPDFGYATKNGGKHEWAGQGCVGQLKRWGRKRGQKLRCDVQIDLGELQVIPVNSSSVGVQVLRLFIICAA